MTIFQIAALAFLMVSALGFVVGFIWIMLLSSGQSVEISFSEIKRAWQARMFRRLAPVLLGVVCLYLTMFGIGFVMLAFDTPMIVSLVWLLFAVYAVVQTVRAFARV